MNTHRFIYVIIIIFILLSACSKKGKSNMVEFDQVNPDGSHNLRHQFREEIEKEKKRNQRYQKGPFE